MSIKKILAGLKLKRGGPDAPAQARATAQRWMPYRDIVGGFIVRLDGHYVGGWRIEPVGLSLLSEREARRRVAGLHEALQGMDTSWQWLVLPRHIDLDSYIRQLDAEQREADGPRQRLLREYSRYVRDIVAGGEAVERRYYLLAVDKDRQTLSQTLSEMRAGLERAGLAATRLDDAGLLDMCHAWAYPQTTASLQHVVDSSMGGGGWYEKPATG